MRICLLQKSSNQESKNLIELLLEIGFIPSKGEGRRLINQGGLGVNNRITDINHTVNLSDFVNNEMIIRKGKNVSSCYFKIISYKHQSVQY